MEAQFISIQRIFIDAICINQDHNKSEKGQQVRLMREIYSLAMQVTAWIGPSSTDIASSISLSSVSVFFPLSLSHARRQKMHWVALHSTGSVSDRLRGGETEVCSYLTLMSALRRRKPWLSCFLQSAINAVMAVTRR